MRWLRSLPGGIGGRLRPIGGWWGGIGGRMSLYMSVALVLGALLVAAFFFWQGKAALDMGLRSRALYIATHLAMMTADSIIIEDSYDISRQTSPIFTAFGGTDSNRDLVYILFYNYHGKLLSGMTAEGPVTPVDAAALSAMRNAGFDLDRSLTEQERDLKSPSFSILKSDLYDLTYPVLVSGYKIGTIRVGFTGKLLVDQFLDFSKKGLFAIVVILFLGLAFSQIIAAKITRPILQLSAAAEDLSHQKWKTPIAVQGNDEISRLGHAFNQMALTLKQREASLSQGNRDLLMLHAAGVDLMESLEIEKLIPKIAGRAEDLVHAETTAISALDPSDRTLKYIGVFGAKAEALKGLAMVLESGGIYNWIASYGTPLLILDAQSDFRLDRNRMSSLGVRTMLTAPLWSSNTMIGLLTAVNKKGDAAFDKHDLRLFTVYTNLISAAFQNARLFGDLKRNMTELKDAQEQLVRSTKMAAIGELAANVAHEINNPLTSVLGYTTHLLKRLEMPEESRNMLAMMEQETLRVRKIIRNLLDFARQRQSCMRRTDLLQPLNETLALIQGVAEASSVKISEEYHNTPIMVNMDANEIKQVFINVVNNALQAMPEGGELMVRAKKKEQNEAMVEFSDTGAGISDENIKKIFEPFFSTKGDRGGTGLGLSISERIMHNHGGRLEVESKLGKGTLFRVVLPVSETVSPA